MTTEYKSPIDDMEDQLLLIIDNNQEALKFIITVLKLDSDDSNRIDIACRALPYVSYLSFVERKQIQDWLVKIDQMLLDDQPDYYIDYWLGVEKHYIDKIAEGV